MSDPMSPEVQAWLKRTEAEPPDAQRSASQVMDRLPEVHQKWRWWPYPVPYRDGQSGATTAATTQRPGPAPSEHDHDPSVIGRTMTMFSPTRAMTAGAIVFTVAGAFLIGQSFDESATTVPAAEGDVVSTDTAWVTGSIRAEMGSYQPLRGAANCRPPERTIEGEVVRERDYYCETQVWEASDPRLNGTATAWWNADVHRLSPSVSVMSGSVREVVNATGTGTWRCTSAPTVGLGTGFTVVDTVANPETFTCVGQDAYEGLTAVLDVHDGDKDNPGSIEGLIFAGEVPPLPETGSP